MMDSIKNYIQLTNDIATAGQPKEVEFKDIAKAGYKSVVNIGMLDHQHAVASENKAVAELGLTYVHIPVAFDSQ